MLIDNIYLYALGLTLKGKQLRKRISTIVITNALILAKGSSCMKCQKCDGLLVLQTFFDHPLNFEGWKCLNCGKIVLKKEKSIEYDSFSLFYQQQKSRNRN